MANVVCRFAAVLLALALSACHEAGIASPAGEAQASVASSVVPVVLAVRGAVESVATAAREEAAAAQPRDAGTDEGVARSVLGGSGRPDGVRELERQKLAAKLIVRWEVTSPAAYARKYEGVIWPGGASGPTWAVGYDGGHQTRGTISRDWADHAGVERLATTSGVVGNEARARITEWAGVKTPFAHAERVFTKSTLPAYTAAARRALGPEFDDLDDGDHAALVSLGYNRGWSLTGPKRAEMRVIRDECVPNRDSECVALQLEQMCRLWPNTPGLCNRRKDEARTARNH